MVMAMMVFFMFVAFVFLVFAERYTVKGRCVIGFRVLVLLLGIL
jgi:hypothetical protein